MTSREFRARLFRRAGRAGVPLSDGLAGELETYFRLLAKWNERINLTGFNLSEPTPETLDRLLIEPLVAARHAPARTARVLDVGSGGGSPAIPFALALGGVRLRMLESKTRKSVFLREAVRALGMPAAEVVTARFEELLASPQFVQTEDVVTVRAVRVDRGALELLQTFVRPGGQLFLFTSGGGKAGVGLPSLLRLVSVCPLIEASGSSLTILQRQKSAGNVPRGTSA